MDYIDSVIEDIIDKDSKGALGRELLVVLDGSRRSGRQPSYFRARMEELLEVKARLDYGRYVEVPMTSVPRVRVMFVYPDYDDLVGHLQGAQFQDVYIAHKGLSKFQEDFIRSRVRQH